MSYVNCLARRALIAVMAACLGAGAAHPVWAGAIPQKNVNAIGPTPINWLTAGNPRMQQNEPECAVSPNNPEWLACGFNDYRAVNDPQIGDAFPGIAMSRDLGRTWISGLHPGHLGDMPNINKKFGADANLEALPNLLLYNFIAGWRDDSQPGGVFVSRWYEHNREVGPPWEHLDTIQVDAGTSGRFLDKPAFDVALYDPGLGFAATELPIPPYDDPRNPANSHPAYTLSVPAARVHLCYAVFVGNDNNDGTKINCLASDDAGQTWPVNSKISESVDINQGVSIATRNHGQSVLAVWRRFSDNNETSAIMYAHSNNFGNSWSKAAVLTEFCGFDQGTGPARFRTNALPVAVSDGSEFSVYFAARNNATETCIKPGKGNKPPTILMSPVSPEHDFDGPDDGQVRTALNFSRIMMVTSGSGNNLNWSVPRMLDPQLVDGSNDPYSEAARKPFHQFMPAAEAASGVTTVSWFDSRFDKLNLLATPIVAGFVEDSVLHLETDGAGGSTGTVLPSGIYELVPPPPALPPAVDNFPLRRNLDTFAAQLVNGAVQPYTVDANFYPAASGQSSNSVRVSRFASRKKPGGLAGEREQLEFNYPNGRLFRKGRAPFIGDYNSVFASQYRQRQDGSWISNQAAPDTSAASTELFAASDPVFHIGWTSNHLVRGRVFYTGCDVWDEALQMWVASPDGCAATYDDPTNPAMMLPLQGEDGSTDGPPPVCQAVAPGQLKPQPLTRNQNIFVAAMKPGINVNVVSAIKFPDGTGFNTFVLDTQNGTPSGRRVRLELPLDDPAVSFDKDDALKQIEVIVPPGSGNARSVFDVANILDDPPAVVVEVFDVTGLDPQQSAMRGTGNKVARVALLREALAPLENVQNNDPDDLRDIVDPADGEFYDFILKREIGTTQLLDLENLDLENTIYMLDLENLDLENLDLENAVLFLDLENLDLENVDLGNLDLENALYEQLDLENLDLENLDLENLDLENLDLENRNLFYLDLENLDLENLVFEQLDLENLDLENLDLENIDIANLDLENLDLENFSIYASDLENLDLENLDLENTAPGDEYTEISWTADSATNTTTGIDIKPLFSDSLASQLTAPGSDAKVLLTVRQPYLTGTVLSNQAGSAPGLYCTPQAVAENQLVYAAILDADQINALIGDPDPADARTPSFVLEPDGSKIITMRIINPPDGLSIQDISRNVGMALYAQPGSNSNCDAELQAGGVDLLDCEIDFVLDTEPPVITLLGGSPIDVEAGPAAYADPGATAADEIDGMVTPVITFNDVDTGTLGSYSVVYTATDASGNAATATRVVNVVDTTAPSITAPADVTVEASGPLTPVAIGTAAADDFIGPLTLSNDSPGSFPVGATTVTWTATDGQGNSAMDTQQVTVTDTTGPMVTLLGDNPLTLEASNDPFTDPGASAIDLVDGDVSASLVVSSDVNPAQVGSYAVSYLAMDQSGNAGASPVRAVNVVDTTAPVILIGNPPDFTPPAPFILPTGDISFTAAWPASAQDLEAGLSISCSTQDQPPVVIEPVQSSYDNATGLLNAEFSFDFPAGTTLVDCTVTDQGGNSTTSTPPFAVLVEDVPVIEANDPVLVLPAENGSSATVFNADLTQNITASDLIDGDISAQASCLGSEPQSFAIGQHAIDCSVVDSGGNSASVSFTLEVIFPYDIVVLKPKGNIQAGSTVPVDWYYTQPGGSVAIDSSGFDPMVNWLGPFGANCSGGSDGSGDGAEDAGSSSIRYSASDDTWRLNWQTPSIGDFWFKLFVTPPGQSMTPLCVKLR